MWKNQKKEKGKSKLGGRSGLEGAASAPKKRKKGPPKQSIWALQGALSFVRALARARTRSDKGSCNSHSSLKKGKIKESARQRDTANTRELGIHSLTQIQLPFFKPFFKGIQITLKKNDNLNIGAGRVTTWRNGNLVLQYPQRDVTCLNM